MDATVQHLLQYYGLDLCALLFTTIGIQLIAKKKRRGFVFGAIGSCFWFAFGVLLVNYPVILANMLIFRAHVNGFRKFKAAPEIATEPK